MAKIKLVSDDEARKLNLEHFVMESETGFALMSRDAVDKVVSYMETKDVVDLGCGDGVALQSFYGKGFSVVGVDINPQKLAKVHLPTVNEDMLSFLKAQESVANIFSHHSLEHTNRPFEVLYEVERVLVAGGVLAIIVPDEYSEGEGCREPHESHLTIFESPQELVPEGFEPLYVCRVKRREPELWAISRKPA